MTLKNAKHERFARALADGKAQVDAFEEAGFKRHRGNASALAATDSIKRRVAELHAERAETEHKATQAAAERLSLSREWVLEMLVLNAKIAHAAADFGPSNRALELIGNAISPGMFATKQILAGDADAPVVTKIELVGPSDA